MQVEGYGISIMKLGYTVWTWLSDEHNAFCHAPDPKAAFEQALREISYLGYQTVENFNWFADYYMDDPQELVDLCRRYGLEFVCLYHYLTPDYASDKAKGLEYCRFAQQIGAPYINLQMNGWREPPWDRPTDPEAITICAEKTMEIAKMAHDHGLKLCAHPHANTPVYTMEQIDLFLEKTDPALVDLCLDTAHITLSGGNAVEAFDRYFDRLAYVHLKDVAPSAPLRPEEKPMRRFRALGQGVVDFLGVYQVLQSRGYDGVVCVELDYQKVCNFESAQFSRAYLKNVLGI